MEQVGTYKMCIVSAVYEGPCKEHWLLWFQDVSMLWKHDHDSPKWANQSFWNGSFTNRHLHWKDPRSCFTRMFKPARWCDFIRGHLDTCWIPDYSDQASKLTRNGPFAKWLLASPSDLSARPATRHPACGKFLGDMSTTAVDWSSTIWVFFNKESAICKTI